MKRLDFVGLWAMAKAIVAGAFGMCLLNAGAAYAQGGVSETGGSETLMILQANTRGNDNSGGGGFATHIVELYNNSDAAIDLTAGNYYMHVGNATVWTGVVKLEGEIPAKTSFLIVSDNTADVNPTPRAALPTADLTADFVFVNDHFRVAVLMNEPNMLTIDNPISEGTYVADGNYVDMLGCGNTLGYEGTATSAQSRPQPPRRGSLLDTDDNSADFVQIDFRGQLSGSNGMADDQLYKFWPRSVILGAWDPMTGEPAVHPEPYPHINDDDEPGPHATEKLMILQANTYGNDNGGGGGFANSLVELYNNTMGPIDLGADNYSLHIGNATAWTNVIALSGVIPAKSSFLIADTTTGDGEHTNATPRADLPAADQEAGFVLVNSHFKVALMRDQAALLSVDNPFAENAAGYVDMLGVGSANGYETAAAGASRPQGPRRASLVDTDNNSADFAQVDYRGTGAGNGMPDSALYKYWPRNSVAGPWNPMTGASIRAELPIVWINTNDEAPIADRETWVRMTFSLTDYANPQNNIAPIENQRIRGRGNSTWGLAKKPYRVRFDADKQQNPFGLGGSDNGARENWVLLADYLDPTSMMNATAFHLGREVFELDYTCTFRHVYLYLNDEFMGVYTLTQHRQADPENVGAPGRALMGTNGGHFVEIDSYWDDTDPKFRTDAYDLPAIIKDKRGATDAQVIADWAALTDSMAAPSFPNNGYRDLINMGTFVDFLMVNETVYNREIYHPKSTFAYKGVDGKISMGPLWDFDQGFYYEGWVRDSDTPLETHAYFGEHEGRLEMHPFFARLFEDSVFVATYKARWNELKGGISDVTDFIATLGAQLSSAMAYDYERWYTDGDGESGYWADYPSNHAAQITAMTQWWNNRVMWLDGALNEVNSVAQAEERLSDGIGEGAVVAFDAAAGKSGFVVGPNPVLRRNGAIVLYRFGKRADSATLTVYDALGNAVNRVTVDDRASEGRFMRPVGSWNLTDAFGRPVAAGTYLLRGTATAGGKREEVRAIIGVR